jgi:hypothetical protein
MTIQTKPIPSAVKGQKLPDLGGDGSQRKFAYVMRLPPISMIRPVFLL